MVKPDLKHNYYADLDLPTTCTIEEIKKQYRKLALQYHPDRNAGKEEEYVPKFQAIQTAHEILGDPASKAKYDTDRRKAGLHAGASFRPNQPTGNPYQATSAYPPPPRRTQPGTWQRPQPSTPGATPSGADRFSNFPRGAAPTARKDPAADRTNMFRAWQNMNNAADRQNRNAGGPATPNRQRPAPPPRNDTRMPSEEEIRAGMNHRKPPPRFDPDRADQRQTAWAAFQQGNTAKPGLSRSNTNRTPKKPGGFDPNVPGSDERPAATGGYAHRHKSADFGKPGSEDAAPFPRPPAPQRTQATPSPSSAGPHRYSDEDIPFAEANRVRTPYGGLGGEKTSFSSEGLRRSASTRDTTKLNSAATDGSRARSTSPHRRQHGTKQNPIVDYSTSESSEDSSDPDHPAESTSFPRSDSGERAGTSFANRPKATPSSRRPKHASSSDNYSTTATTGAPSNGQASNGNMYAPPLLFCNLVSPEIPSFDPKKWSSQMFGPLSRNGATQGRIAVPLWAIPSSIVLAKPQGNKEILPPRSDSAFAARPIADKGLYKTDQDAAFALFCDHIRRIDDKLIKDVDFEVFSKLMGLIQQHNTTGIVDLDDILRPLLCAQPLAFISSSTSADNASSFTFPASTSAFPPHSAKSRTAENIDTSFSPDGFSGKFAGTPDYFPTAKPNSRRQSPSVRSRTQTHPPTDGEGARGFAASPTVGEQQQKQSDVPSGGVNFSKEEWEKTFKDGSWTWPPPPPNPPLSPSKAPAKSRSTSRKASKAGVKGAGSHEQPYVIDDDSGAFQGEGDAMDIDPPVTQQGSAQPAGATPEPRLYSVPPSAWRQQQASGQFQARPLSSSGKLNTNLNDLADVVPLARAADGLDNLADISSTLPFPSQAAATLPTQPLAPQKLQVPALPKPPEAPARLTRQSWQAYAREFGLYISAHHQFNTKMLQHFSARENQAQARLSAGLSWLEAVGETSTGFGGYLQGIREDEKVREAWVLGSERHKEATETFQRVRDMVKRQAANGQLADQ